VSTSVVLINQSVADISQVVASLMINGLNYMLAVWK